MRWYLKVYEHYDEVPEDNEVRVIDEQRSQNEGEKDLIKKYGVLEIDLVAYNSRERKLLLGDVTRENKLATVEELKKFYEKAQVFIKRWEQREKLINRTIRNVELWFISIRGFEEKAKEFAEEHQITWFNRDRLIQRLNEHNLSDLFSRLL
ncbi:MAG: hypothetical protein QXJ07_03160 [Candidatus Bathyarchaeia archaeon]